MSDKIREALAGMLAIHDDPSGFAGKYGRALDDAIAAQQAKIDQRVAAARAALAQQPTQAAPDGWKLVPAEPTREMWAAAGDCVTTLQWSGIGHHDKISSAVYRAMLAAAPAAPAPAPAAQEPLAWVYYCREDLNDVHFSAQRWVDAHHEWIERPLYAAPPAAEQPATEQPDTVKVPRELLRELADIADSMQCFDARDDAMGLLDKELEG